MRKQQIEREIERLHENWIRAIQETPGTGPKRFQGIMDKRAEIAREKQPIPLIPQMLDR